MRRLGLLTALGIAYFVAGKLGLQLALLNPSATAVWPATGLALAALVVLGPGAWPAILVGAFLVNITTTGAVATSLGIAFGNTAEAFVGAHLVNRFANGRRVFDRARDLFKFTVLAGFVEHRLERHHRRHSHLVGRICARTDFGPVWLTWWMGDAAGAVVVAPVVLLEHDSTACGIAQVVEAAVLLLGVVAVRSGL
jgi:integral membrane sensor domain MASE1